MAYIVMAYMGMACIVMAYMGMDYIFMAGGGAAVYPTVLTTTTPKYNASPTPQSAQRFRTRACVRAYIRVCIAMAHIVMAYIVIVNIAMAYIVMAGIVMACIHVACIHVAYTVYGLYGLWPI